jgi:predicted ATPase
VSDNPVRDNLLHRLAANGKENEPFAVYVAYACDGDEALARLVDDGATAAALGDPVTAPAETAPTVPRAYLKNIKVRAFRGIGPERTLSIPEGHGLTIVSGRNGCGKSSFAEAVELLLTDQCSRFGTAVAAEGWRNHHESETTLIAAELTLEQTGVVTFSRRWGKGAVLKDGETVVKDAGPTRTLADTPWLRAARDYRPFLAYSQLGEMLDGKSALYDALMTGLGLERYGAVRQRLMDAARVIDKRQDDAKREAAAVMAAAQAASTLADDPRLEDIGRLLSGRTWDLDAIGRLVADDLADDGRGLVLRQLATLRAPTVEDGTAAVSEVRAAAERVRQIGERSAGRARQLADLLERSLDVTKTSPSAACPVCDTPDVIDAAWRSRTRKAADALRAEAAEADDAQTKLDRARARALQFCVAPPPVLGAAIATGFPADQAQQAWKAFAGTPAGAADPESLARHVEATLPSLQAAVAELVATAQAELARREDVWRPVAQQLAAWMKTATQAEAGKETKKHLRKAEDWLKDVIEDIRHERFEPIAQQATRYWSMLRLQSSVDLRDVQMVGSGTRRSVQLDVSVEGIEASALSVMSQGEMNSLALSLFLPRATMPESPFGFVIIDDPVQALDPAKVEGLARVLAEAASSHQVVVLTHDDRLPEAVRRLEISATFVDITRKDRSVVEIRRIKGPVAILLEDAHAIAKTEHMPDAIKLRLVPNFCRSALEAACHEVLRARWLRRGDLHTEVEDRLVKAGKLRSLMALALFDEVDKAGEVEQRLGSVRKATHKQTFRDCLEGAHGEFVGEPIALIAGTQALVEYLRTTPVKP